MPAHALARVGMTWLLYQVRKRISPIPLRVYRKVVILQCRWLVNRASCKIDPTSSLAEIATLKETLICLAGNRSVSKTDSTPEVMTVADIGIKRGVKSPFFVLFQLASDSFLTLVVNQKLS